MTKEQENHLKMIQDYFNLVSTVKYRKGQKEHGGNLWENPILDILDNAIEEAVDQVVYLTTLRNELPKYLKEN